MHKIARNILFAALASATAASPLALSLAQTSGETLAQITSPADVSVSREAALIGLPVIDIKGVKVGIVDNVVLGRADGPFVVIKLDKAFLRGHRLVAIYDSRLQKVEERSLGISLQLTHLRKTDIKDFPTFSYTDDMQLAAPR
ncbi:PRC-barrel domain-containing protein [Aquisalinus flavus]|uniref:PRC-barrel domain-containing protein n=1 Tax=Aquisalinus flavus TaxID=1526572 RepID=A0A8J2V490_9PROT|nr:PRC-barrel domain-containing protein [Aquisalinus flavus]MBD0427029.1 PRC-barrel domain-containing protein [Aquisalinus flavus]GGC97803.1 hypothetical protein GCM10011342_03430 [Aquisalinus flavus]